MAKRENNVPQVLLKHSAKGYRYIDRDQESHALRNDWMTTTKTEQKAYADKQNIPGGKSDLEILLEENRKLKAALDASEKSEKKVKEPA